MYSISEITKCFNYSHVFLTTSPLQRLLSSHFTAGEAEVLRRGEVIGPRIYNQQVARPGLETKSNSPSILLVLSKLGTATSGTQARASKYMTSPGKKFISTPLRLQS